MSKDDSLLRLAFGGIAPRSIDRLFASFGEADRVLDAVLGGRTRMKKWVMNEIAVAADERREQLQSLGVSWMSSTDRQFPSRLSRFEHGPRWLFLRGRVREAPAIAIIGTRTCTTYGTDLATEHGAAAARLGWTVVSGMARGIDSAAHSGAVTAGGHCQVVLGSGIDVIYPRQNTVLHESILAGGGMVCSEYPPGTRPDAWRFPTRNRILAGLADVVLVVEAGNKGGALITARIALDYGVPIFAVPGDVDRVASIGTNLLIRDGAFPVFGADDLSEVLALVTPFAATGDALEADGEARAVPV